MAAVLACGDLAALSHRSATELWGFGYEERGRIDVTVRRECRIKRSGLRVKARAKLPERSVVRRFGIPVTNPVQTLIDLATELKILRLERAVNEADKLDLVDPETLRRALDAYVGMPGVKTLRTMLDRHTFRRRDGRRSPSLAGPRRARRRPRPLDVALPRLRICVLTGHNDAGARTGRPSPIPTPDLLPGCDADWPSRSRTQGAWRALHASDRGHRYAPVRRRR
jgi:hypothetical protein